MNQLIKVSAAALVCAAASSSASAAEILVTGDITTSTTWTADNTYNLQDQVYVKNGATLTIEAGTVIASTTGIGGSLAVSRGANIQVLGTKDNPVIMTSKADVATWTGGDPKTGTWREAVNEWGNLTIMGRGYISENAEPGNVPTPNASNVAQMEGLIAAFPGDPDVLYGGGNNGYNAGTIQYLSLRYGGRVVGLNNELNGLSLGGVGRNTDIHHIDIMNNVDDGIEIWGGAAHLKYVNIWNIGDDSFDIDQGWTGRAQFVCIVQGYGANAAQGSGVGDNCFELDGAEDSDWQPVTSAVIYNATVIGQPKSGDHGTAWRDGARVQFRNCLFMDLGEQLIKNDQVDGDGGNGYGHNGTLTLPQVFQTDFDQYSTVNAPADPANFYKAQVDGKLAEMTDSVFYNNLNGAAYDKANQFGVLPGNGTNNNVLATEMPIKLIERAPPVFLGALEQVRVIKLDPRPANDAAVSAKTAPDDGFFTPAKYRGAFGPSKLLVGNETADAGNWLCGWTAADAFGFTVCGEQVRTPTRL